MVAERGGVHPVLDVLLARRARADRPDDRGDPYHVVLAVEGGGSRAAISGGMVMALAERGMTETFDAVYGASAGTLNAAWLVTGATARGIPAWYRPGVMRRVTGLPRVLTGRPVVDMRWVVEHLYENVVPLAWDRVLDAPVPLHPMATDADTGDAIDLRTLVHDTATLKTALRASTHLPLLGGPPVTLAGRRLLDAALAETLPFRTPLADGATHVLLLRTRRADDPPRRPWRSGDLLARALLAATAPGAARSWRSRYERQLADEVWLATHPDTVLTIRPPAGSPAVTQRATDERLLAHAAAAGRSALLDAVPAVLPA